MYYLDDTSQNIYVIYYMKQVSHEDFSHAFKMYITDNLFEDFKAFDDRVLTSNPSGVVILPLDKPYFISLISKESKEDVYFHELTHVHDVYLYKKYFHLETNHEIRSHKHFKAFSIWTEYHAKYIELMHAKLFRKFLSGNNTNEFLYLQSFMDQEQVKIWKKGINQYNCTSFHDVMYLFALINLCKKYTKEELNAENNTTIPWDYYDLIPILEKIESFPDFLLHLVELESLVSTLPLN